MRTSEPGPLNAIGMALIAWLVVSVVLKCVHVIEWRWMLVLMPAWILIVFMLICICTVASEPDEEED